MRSRQGPWRRERRSSDKHKPWRPARSCTGREAGRRAVTIVRLHCVRGEADIALRAYQNIHPSASLFHVVRECFFCFAFPFLGLGCGMMDELSSDHSLAASLFSAHPSRELPHASSRPPPKPDILSSARSRIQKSRVPPTRPVHSISTVSLLAHRQFRLSPHHALHAFVTFSITVLRIWVVGCLHNQAGSAWIQIWPDFPS